MASLFVYDAPKSIPPKAPAPPALAPLANGCDSCRHHSKEKRPNVLGAAESITGDDSLVETDGEIIVFSCRAKAPAPHAGKTVGTVPVTCVAYEPGKKVPAAQLDALMGRFK